MKVRLTKNFLLQEFLRSEAAARHGINMTPDIQVIANLTRLCATVLQPLRDYLDTPVTILSGYRPLELNRLIGGVDQSQHIAGLAADFIVSGISSGDLIYEIVELSLEYDQLIDEFGQWAHVSVSAPTEGPRYERLKAARVDGKVMYDYIG